MNQGRRRLYCRISEQLMIFVLFVCSKAGRKERSGEFLLKS